MSQPLSHRPHASSVGLIAPWPTRHQSKVEHDHRLAPSLHEVPLLDELGRLSQNDSGWILLIAPPKLPAAEQLRAQGINPARILVVHGAKIKNWQRMLEQSLGNGHCAAVLTWLPEQIALDRAKLNTLGQRTGVLTRFFEPKGAPLPANGVLSYGGQDVYLNH
ncbi:cell division inhibitor [Aeromonas lusitana]|uniref:Cell division inhibitor n=1 Tax=Aeromonas lusitana TaxID=931529 RepID=A0A2M8H6B4_9GAMM|nr:cell division inhibitor [Aeromonas lusitana]PJC92107.1 cell division inhibitor [Aeromonas lusitana]